MTVVSQSSGSTPTLPYSHGQADFSSLTPPSSSVPTSSLPMPISQNVTINHFPLSSFFSNFPHHSSFQSSSTSLPDPPPYPSTVLLAPLGSTLQGNPLPSIHPQATPLLSSNPLAWSSFSFHQPTFLSQPFLNPWSLSHPIYHPKPVYATVNNTNYFSNTNISSSLSTLSISTSSILFNINPTFTTISSTPRSSSSGPSRRRPTRGWQRGWGRCNIYYSSRKPYLQTFDSHTSSFNNLNFSSSNLPWSCFSRYLCPDGSIDLSTRPRFANYTSGETLINPFLRTNLSQPRIFSPMITFNEPSEHVRDMFTIVYSCNFLPGGNHKLTLSIYIKK